MKKTFLLLLSAMTLLPTSAQDRLVADGFYRVQNYGSKRYAYVYDNTGSVNLSTTSADMGAIVLAKDPNKRFCDPASVLYASCKGKSGTLYLYDLETQGTGVNKIINYYVTVVKPTEADIYWVYEPTYNMYLWDEIRSTYYDTSHMGTNSVKDAQNRVDNNYRSWSILPVNAATSEYLGIKPSDALHVGSKYYKPYYLGFAFDFASNGMKAYYVSDVKTDAVIISEAKGTVPAATPVIVECSSNDGSANRINLYHDSPAKIANNKLSGNYFCYANHGPTAYRVYDAATMRVLGVKDGRLCYVTDNAMKYGTKLEFSDGTNTTTKYCLNANESYLQVPAGTAADLPVMTQEEYDALHPATKKGDINGDGKVDAVDVAYLYRAIAAGTQASAAPQYDIDGNGSIDAIDVAMIYRIIAKES